MNSFVSALLASSALASLVPVVTEVTDPYSSTYKTSTAASKFRFGDITTTTMIDTTSLKWDVIMQVNVNEDSGDSNLRITHELTANIQKTDTVTFELSFVPESKWDNVDDSDYASGLGEDAGRCELTNNVDDEQFWEVTLTDIYYKCNGTPAAPVGTTEPLTTKCSDAANTYNSNSVLSESSSNNQWTSPFEDDDSDAPWCTPANTEGGSYSPYQCTKIKCVMERLLDTGDTTYDWAFSESDDGTGLIDNMMILNGRAQVWITSATYDVAMTAPTDSTTVADATPWDQTFVRIPIYKNARMAAYMSIGALLASGAALMY